MRSQKTYPAARIAFGRTILGGEIAQATEYVTEDTEWHKGGCSFFSDGQNPKIIGRRAMDPMDQLVIVGESSGEPLPTRYTLLEDRTAYTSLAVAVTSVPGFCNAVIRWPEQCLPSAQEFACDLAAVFGGQRTK